MNKMTATMLSAVLGFTLALAGGGDAEAARMGGGKSFGGRPSYSDSYRRSPAEQPSFGQSGAATRQQAYSQAQQRNQTLRDSLAQRGGFMRMLGGLALGGMLGALLFGGAFEGINFLDILMLGGIAFLLFKLFAAKKRGQEGMATPAGYYPAGHDDVAEAARPYPRASQTTGPAGFDTDILSRRGGAAPAFEARLSPQPGPVIPADFDAPAFLKGAETAYRMMQQAWDAGSLADLRGLTTDKVFAELQDQVRARGGAANHTELLRVEVELLEVRDQGADREATVLFDVLLREAPGAEPAQVREVWHFTRPRNSRQRTWFLDGIQQVED